MCGRPSSACKPVAPHSENGRRRSDSCWTLRSGTEVGRLTPSLNANTAEIAKYKITIDQEEEIGCLSVAANDPQPLHPPWRSALEPDRS